MDQLPTDLVNIIVDYRLQLNHTQSFAPTLNQIKNINYKTYIQLPNSNQSMWGSSRTIGNKITYVDMDINNNYNMDMLFMTGDIYTKFETYDDDYFDDDKHEQHFTIYDQDGTMSEHIIKDFSHLGKVVD